MEAGLKTVPSNWSNTVLVCKKCSKKLGGGFGPKGRTPLAKALRRSFDVKKGRKGALGIVEVKCLGVCPRGAVTLIDGRRPGEWLIVRGGAGIDEVATALALGGVPVEATIAPVTFTTSLLPRDAAADYSA